MEFMDIDGPEFIADVNNQIADIRATYSSVLSQETDIKASAILEYTNAHDEPQNGKWPGGFILLDEMTDSMSNSAGSISGDLRLRYQFLAVKVGLLGYCIGFSKREPRKPVGIATLGCDSRIRWIKGMLVYSVGGLGD